MSTLYPRLPVEPQEMGYPAALHELDNGKCPVCKRHWITIRSYEGGCAEYGSVWKDFTLPYPHVQYSCGGVWRDWGDGYWEGKCWAGKSQKFIVFQEDP
jgi:hypothetical protein